MKLFKKMVLEKQVVAGWPESVWFMVSYVGCQKTNRLSSARHVISCPERILEMVMTEVTEVAVVS